MKLSLFNCAILWHPNESEIKEGRNTILVAPPVCILAADKDDAKIKLVLRTPDTYLNKTSQLEYKVTPF